MTALDAVVIGAGHNGLVAANLLADAGWDVMVVEASEYAGGAVRSDRSVHPDYVTDLYSAFYPMGIASPVLQRLDLGAHGLQWSHAPAVLAHVLPDGRCALLGRDPATTARSMEGFAPGDGDAWLDLVADFERIQQALIGALFQPFPPVRNAISLLRTLGAGGALRMARFGLLPVRRFGDEAFDGEGAPLLLAGNALHTDLPPEGAGSALFGWLLAMIGQVYGFPVPVGGSGRLVDALVHRLGGRGEIRLGSPATSILIEGGRAAGVRLASGETIRARAVLADVDAPRLFQDLVGAEHLPARLMRDLETFQWDMPTVKLDWALSAPIPWTAHEARGAGTVHLGVDMDGLSRYAAALATREIPREPFVLLGQMTTADATRSPAGTESAWAYTHLPEKKQLTAQDIDEHAERVEALIERHAPGFRDSIVRRVVQAPDDLQNANPNLHRGAVNAGTAALHQQLVFRPVPGLSGADTPVPGLYLAGATAHPGGGVHGGPGANGAHAALSGSLRRRAVQAALRRIYAD